MSARNSEKTNNRTLMSTIPVQQFLVLVGLMLTLCLMDIKKPSILGANACPQPKQTNKNTLLSISTLLSECVHLTKPTNHLLSCIFMVVTFFTLSFMHTLCSVQILYWYFDETHTLSFPNQFRVL